MTIANETLDLCKTASHQTYLSLSITLRELGCLCNELKASRKALQCYMQCLKIQRSLFKDKNKKEIALTLLKIAQTYKEQQDYGESMKFYNELYKIQLDVYGPSSPEIASCLSCMGLVQYLKGNYRSSLRFYREALRVREGLPKSEATQLDISQTLNSIGLISFKIKSYEKAKQAFIKCIQARRKIESLHTSMEDSILYSNLATTYLHTGQFQEALKLYRSAIQLERKVHGEKSLAVAVSLQHLAHLYSVHGEIDEAYVCLTEALEITLIPTNIVMLEQPETVAKLYNLIGNIHHMKANIPLMMECYEKACRILPGFNNNISVAGHTFSWISRTNPPCAPVA